IHNVKQTDLVIAIDDKDCINLMRLFNEEAGQKYLEKIGVPNQVISNLPLLGISSIANLLMTIKFAKYFELTRKDTLMTVFTDSMIMYQSRLKEYEKKFGKYQEIDAAIDFHRSLRSIKTDSMVELRYFEKQRIHQLKYFTWVEQQGKSVDELNRQWYDEEDYWNQIYQAAPQLDNLIKNFNKEVGLL
ncbi:MAG: pyridoxal-5-phosphate-dependent protein subunit beta, partial [Candidatus Heimdallarchaeota archaeon]